MPIRALKNFSTACNWPLASLNNSKIAIDGFWFIRKYFSALEINEMMCSFEDYVTRQLKGILGKCKDIQFLWVWDGLKYKPEMKDASSELEREISFLCENRKLKFGKSIDVLELFVTPVNNVLTKYGIEFCRAPYGAIAQIAYFYNNKCVDYIFTKSDVFLFNNVDRAIIEFDFKNNSLCFFDRNEIEKTLKIKKHVFKLYMLASGCEFSPTIPEFSNEFDNELFREFFITKVFKNDSVPSNFGAIKAFYTQNIVFCRQIENGLYFHKLHPIMSLNGKIEPVENFNTHVDMVSLFGIKLPVSFYEALFECKVQPIGISEYVFNQSYHSKSEEINKIKDLTADLLNYRLKNKSDSNFILDIIKDELGLKTDHDKEQERTLEIAFLHFVKNTKNVCTPLINCIVGKRALNENLHNLEANFELKKDDFIMFFRLREYVNWYKIFSLFYSEFEKTISNYSLFDFSTKFCAPVKNTGLYKSFVAKFNL